MKKTLFDSRDPFYRKPTGAVPCGQRVHFKLCLPRYLCCSAATLIIHNEHNGKVERSHREDQKRFYNCHAFFSLEDFDKQLQIHNRRSNNIPMRPLHWLSPFELAVQYV